VRAAVAIFFCLAALFLFILSIRAEILEETHPRPQLVHKNPRAGTPPHGRVGRV
jgi:hypothetical protein